MVRQAIEHGWALVPIGRATRPIAALVCLAGAMVASEPALAGPVKSYFTQPYAGSVPLFGCNAMSSDGAVAVGWVDNPLTMFMFDQAWLLTPCSTVQLPDLGVGAYANGVSDGGTVVVGSIVNWATGFESAVRWDAPGYGWSVLPSLGGPGSVARAVTPDGAVIVGMAQTAAGSQFQGCIWAYGGPAIGVGTIAGYNLGILEGVAPDASAAVGYAQGATGTRAVWFRPGAGLSLLPNPTGGVFTAAYSVSSSPNRIVGVGTIGNTWRAMVSDGVTTLALGVLPGDLSSAAYGISADGSVITGISSGTGPVLPLIDRAFVYTSGTGMIDLKATLVGTLGYTGLSTWHLVSGKGVASGARAIAGQAVSSAGGGWAGFLIQLCPADMNRDGATDLNDVPVFFSLFNAGDCRADLDENGLFTQGDVTQMALGLMGGC